MISIPSSTKKFSQPNTSDLFGNIYYTKNINFDEPGYIKLSNRSAAIMSNQNDANFGIVPSFGRIAAGQFLIPTSVNPYVVSLFVTSIGVSPDPNANKPTSLGFTTWARWWNNKWYVASRTQLYYRDQTGSAWNTITVPIGSTSQGNWDASTNTPTLQSGIGTAGFYYTVNVAGNTVLDAVSVWNVGDIAYFNGSAWVKAIPTSTFTSGNIHALEVFRNRNTLCVADGNKIIQFDTSFVQQQETNLIIQSDFQISGMAYNGNRMGIITTLSPQVAGKNIDAYFFVWDGSSSEANSGYPIGSDTAIAVVSYKSSWVILTRKGQLLYFNGGGFDVLATFPFYFKDQLWGDFQNQLAYGDSIQVNGDYIYVNIAGDLNTFGIPVQNYSPNFPSGVWCYDPSVGLYHRYSPSISPVMVGTIESSAIDLATGELTILTGATVPATGSPVRYVEDNNNPIGGLKTYATYFVINVSSTVFKLATTRADAIAGNSITLTSLGASTHYFMFLNLLDYGASRSSRVGGVGLQGVTNQVYQQLIYSGYYPNISDTVENPTLCIDIPFFPARGCIVTAKVTSGQVQDEYSKVFTKFSFLQDADVIVLKHKIAQIPGLPISTNSQGCVWVNDQTFTTDQDISAAFNYINDDKSIECDIIAGAGAGQTSNITSITLNAGVYTVILDEEIEGITTGNLCDVCIENWVEFDRITVSDVDGFKESPIGLPSKDLLVKAELRGVSNRMRLESLQIINSTQTEAQ